MSTVYSKQRLTKVPGFKHFDWYVSMHQWVLIRPNLCRALIEDCIVYIQFVMRLYTVATVMCIQSCTCIYCYIQLLYTGCYYYTVATVMYIELCNSRVLV